MGAKISGIGSNLLTIEGVKELLPANEQLLVPVGQVNALAWSITKLLSNTALRRRLATSARKLAETEFGVDKYVSRVERVLLKATRNSALDA